MGVLRSIFEPSAPLAALKVAQFTHGRRIGMHAVSDDCLRLAVALQCLLQEQQSRGFVSFLRDVALKNFAFVIDSAPTIVPLSVDLYKHLVEVPLPLPEALHPADPLPPNVGRKHGTEPVLPQPHGLVTDVDPAFEQQVFCGPKRERKPDVHQHDKADDLGRGVEIAERTGGFSMSGHGRALPSSAHFSIRCVCFDSAGLTGPIVLTVSVRALHWPQAIGLYRFAGTANLNVTA